MVETCTAGCKINLLLKIVGVREDGYHLIDSLFWPVTNPYDTLEFTVKPKDYGFKLSCNIHDIDLNNNTLTKAYHAFIKASPLEMGLHVNLIKNIPHGAGLGGASSNAACLLKWLNKNAKSPLTTQQLSEIALKVGADVPFFLKNLAARVQGIGEVIEPIENFLKNKSVLLVCPPIHISTPKAFAAWDEAQKNIFCNEDLTKSSHKDKHTFSYAANAFEFGNDFENVIFTNHPKLAKIKKALSHAGAEVAVMSGSGSTIVGVFANNAKATEAAKSMEHEGYRLFVSAL